jgi:hypothetical protein
MGISNNSLDEGGLNRVMMGNHPFQKALTTVVKLSEIRIFGDRFQKVAEI